jgi:DNA-binding transcriptional ArsR family regulator
MAAGGTGGDADIAKVAGLLANPTRCRVLLALRDGGRLSATRLAADTGVAASTASEHLAKLVQSGLVSVERRGRHRYFRLAGPHVVRLMDSVAGLASASQGPQEPSGPSGARALREAP